ncbi:uncharacterized protein V6R79_013251 [Siganus canaliculatus]
MNMKICQIIYRQVDVVQEPAVNSQNKTTAKQTNKNINTRKVRRYTGTGSGTKPEQAEQTCQENQSLRRCLRTDSDSNTKTGGTTWISAPGTTAGRRRGRRLCCCREVASSLHQPSPPSLSFQQKGCPLYRWDEDSPLIITFRRSSQDPPPGDSRHQWHPCRRPSPHHCRHPCRRPSPQPCRRNCSCCHLCGRARHHLRYILCCQYLLLLLLLHHSSSGPPLPLPVSNKSPPDISQSDPQIAGRRRGQANSGIANDRNLTNERSGFVDFRGHDSFPAFEKAKTLMEHPTFKRASNGTLLLRASTEAQALGPRQPAGGQTAYRAKKPEEVDAEAWAHVVSEGGDPANAALVLSRWKVQFGRYRGKTFHWLLENDVGYCVNLVASHQKEREREGSQSPLMANKDAFTRYFSA